MSYYNDGGRILPPSYIGGGGRGRGYIPPGGGGYPPPPVNHHGHHPPPPHPAMRGGGPPPPGYGGYNSRGPPPPSMMDPYGENDIHPHSRPPPLMDPSPNPMRRVAPPGGPGPAPPKRIATPTTGGPSGGNIKYANDCEIIVTAKAQQQYAEMIEKTIREQNLKVDIMFPKPDVKLSGFIENLGSVGTVFAVIIRPENEKHRSVSVHVLRGCPKPEEHRNMPLDVAYSMIKKRYLEIKRKEVGIVPENMKKILNHLLEELPLADKEYCTVIKFLQDRRRKIKAFEHRTDNVVKDAMDQDLLSNPDAEELKHRILSLMNGTQKSTDEGEGLGGEFPPKPKVPLDDIEIEPGRIKNPMAQGLGRPGY